MGTETITLDIFYLAAMLIFASLLGFIFNEWLSNYSVKQARRDAKRQAKQANNKHNNKGAR